MAPDNPPIIADATVGTAARRLFWIVFAAAGVLGSLAAMHYASMGLTLSHYDARAHLIVARRVFDSLTPGWRQLGGTWLPLPHLLNLVPVAWDVNYRTGASAVVLSIAALGWGLASFAGYVWRQTGSAAAAVAAPLLILANPNVLYLQSTPMTEPLLIGLSLAAVVALDAWARDPRAGSRRHAGLVIAALVLTRYEGWLVAAGLIGLGGAAVLSGSTRTRTAAERRIGAPEIVRLAAYPALAIAAFCVLSWASTGRWLITSGFFEANNPARHQPLVALDQVTSAAFDLAGPVLIALGIAGGAACVWRARRPAALPSLLPLALLLPALLPFSAFDAGHPYRVRYMVPLVAACGALSAFAIGLVPARGRTAAALAVVAAAIALRPPLDAHAPMVLEAQRESPTRDERRAITRYLAASYDGTPILASMDSLGHYMQETSAIGLDVRNFVHEGNGDLWFDALASPRRHVHWVLIEELAEGGDQLAQRARRDPMFLSGFTRVAEGGGAALYRSNR
jgi:hypothetical protein